MTQPEQKGYFNGQLFVSRAGNQYERLDPQDVIGAVFKSEDMSLLFRSSIGTKFNFNQDDVVDEGDRKVYYPYFNETTVEMNNPRVEDESLELVEEDVSLRYIISSDDLFVRSQVEVTAYAPIHLVTDGNLYSVEDPLIVEGGEDFERDELLGFGSSENSVRVKNVETGLVGAVQRSKVDDLMESDEPNGAIDVLNPEPTDPVLNTVRDLTEE